MNAKEMFEALGYEEQFKGCYQLKSLKEKGYFKNVDKNELIKDIIENCEVV